VLRRDSPPERRTCWRYRAAVERLEALEALSVEAMRDVLDAVHQDGPAHTLYSNVYDLKNRLVYLYHFYNYDDAVVLDLAALQAPGLDPAAELAQGYHARDLPSLFPPNPEADAWAAPRLQQREALIASRQAPGLEPDLQAYAGAYELPEGWGAPDQALTVIAGERSLRLRLPGRGWTRDNANSMLAGLCELNSGRFICAWQHSHHPQPQSHPYF
jgi:hypothetical protein